MVRRVTETHEKRDMIGERDTSTDDALRAQFRSGRCHHALLAGFIADASPLRAQLDAAGWTLFDEPDRGHYEVNRTLVVDDVFAGLCATAEAIVGRRLRIERAVWLRFRHRDYQLTKDDARERPLVERHVELLYDFSTGMHANCEMVYTDGRESWIVPQIPSVIALVEREPWLYRYARYFAHTVGDAVVYRLRLTLVDAEAH
jgi:hypothetical protein